MVTVALQVASGDESGMVNCCCSSPAKIFLVPSPMVLIVIFHCLTTLGVVQHSLSGDGRGRGRGRVRVRVRVTLRLPVYRQSVRLGAKPRETHYQRLLQLNPCDRSP
jgi:hypothetical protein